MTTTTVSSGSADATENETDLLRGISDGDPAVWDELLSRYGKLVFATVRSFRLQEADALDATQTTWLRLAEHADQVQSPERLGGWLASTARRECLRILRQDKHKWNFTNMAPETVSDSTPGPEQQVIDAHAIRDLRQLIDELSPRRRTLIQMLFTDSPCSYTKLAHIIGIPVGGIGPTRARALRQLRSKFDEYEVGLT